MNYAGPLVQSDVGVSRSIRLSVAQQHCYRSVLRTPCCLPSAFYPVKLIITYATMAITITDMTMSHTL